MSGLGAGPFKSKEAVAATGSAAESALPSTQPRSTFRRSSYTVVSAIDVGTRHNTAKTDAGLSDVPIAGATFVYSPLIMADIGQRSGLLTKLANPNAPRLGGNPFPNAHAHAVSLNITDPPPSLLTGTSTGAGTLSASPVLAHLQRRRSSVVAIEAGHSRGRAAQDVAKPGTQPPSLNLYLLATLQQVR